MTIDPAGARAEDTATDFRMLMAGFPTGVAVVTTLVPGERPWGMTCSSVCSVTLRPPTLLVCLRHGSPTLSAILRQRTFAVNLLHDGARATAELFASGSVDRFDQVVWHVDGRGGGPHLLADSHAIADCRVKRTEVEGDHVVVFGEVFQAARTQVPQPLLYGLRQYAAWPGNDFTARHSVHP